MPKKIFAVTNINAGLGKFVEAGKEVDHKALGFTKEDLEKLLDEGAIEVRVVEDEPAPSTDSTEEAPKEGTTPEGSTPEGATPTE